MLGNLLRGKSVPGEKLFGGVARQLDSAALKPGAEPVQYRTVAQEVEAFSRNLDDGGRNHDALGHALTFKNSAKLGGEQRAIVCEEVAKHMISSPGEPPSFARVLKSYYSGLEGFETLGYRPRPIPEETLRKWFDLSVEMMTRNIERWGGVPKSTKYEDLKHLLVRRKWS